VPRTIPLSLRTGPGTGCRVPGAVWAWRGVVALG
jgi:hypothetical protein